MVACKVAAGAWHGMALTEDGEVYTWGHNASGQVMQTATTYGSLLSIAISVMQDPNTHTYMIRLSLSDFSAHLS